MEAGMIETYSNGAVLADAAAHAVHAQLAAALRTHGRAGLVATGGRSPGPVYDRLAAASLDWTRAIVTLPDARAIFLLIAGEAKRGVIGRALAGEDLPVGRLISQAKAPIRIFWTPD